MGIKEKWPQSYLSYFSMVFHWRIFLLSRANRLYSIFLHWLEEPGVPRVSGILLSSTRNTGYGSSARYEPCSKTDFLIIYFRWGERVPTSVLGVPANHLASLFSPLVSGDLRLLSTNTCWYPLCDLHSSLTVTLWRLDTVNSNTRSSNFISLLPVGYHVTQLKRQCHALVTVMPAFICVFFCGCYIIFQSRNLSVLWTVLISSLVWSFNRKTNRTEAFLYFCILFQYMASL